MKPLAEKYAKEQLGRIQHLPGFPSMPLAIRDYIAALCSMLTQEGILRLMDEIVALDWDRAPTARQIASIGQSLRDKEQQKRAQCPGCGGAGAVTVWNLVTYRGNSWVIQKSERIPKPFSYEQAMEFARKLVDRPDVRQTVLSAAEACGCRLTT